MDKQEQQPGTDGTAAFLRWAAGVLSKEAASDATAFDALMKPDLEKNLVRLVMTPEFRRRYPGLFYGLSIDAPPIRVDVAVSAAQLRQLVDHVRTTWEELGRNEPHWSVLSADEYLKQEFGTNAQTFYDTGAPNVALIETTMARNGLTLQFDRVVELGCGVGRVTVPLSRKFKEVFAYDISEPHLKLAARLAEEHGAWNISFRQVVDPGKGLEPNVDLFYSELVLQHNPPPVIHTILDHALPSLKPGGIAFFQVPTYRRGYRFKIADFLRDMKQTAGQIEMHCIPQRYVFALAEKHDCRVVEVRTGQDQVRHVLLSNYFVLQKR